MPNPKAGTVTPNIPQVYYPLLFAFFIACMLYVVNRGAKSTDLYLVDALSFVFSFSL